MQIVDRCYPCSPHLQPNWAWRSRESPGSFVSLLAEQTLLTSGTRLTICTLKRSQSGDTSVGGTVGLTDTADEIQNDLNTQYRLNTYSRTRCSNRSLRAGRTRWTLYRRRNTSTIASFTKPYESTVKKNGLAL